MQYIKIAFLAIAAAAVLSGCAPQSVSAVPYTGGDVCEWAKKNLVVAQQEYNEIGGVSSLTAVPVINFIAIPASSPAFQARAKLKKAQETVIAACNSEEKKDGAWACAEGHSCK